MVCLFLVRTRHVPHLQGAGIAGTGRAAAVAAIPATPALLRNRNWRGAVDELKELAAAGEDRPEICSEIAYLRKHGGARRLKYPKFRELGLPPGSVASNRTTHRIVNNRLKSNSFYCQSRTAAALLQLRAQIDSARWDSRMKYFAVEPQNAIGEETEPRGREPSAHLNTPREQPITPKKAAFLNHKNGNPHLHFFIGLATIADD